MTNEEIYAVVERTFSAYDQETRNKIYVSHVELAEAMRLEQEQSVPIDDIEYVIARYTFRVERGELEQLDRVNAWLDKVRPLE